MIKKLQKLRELLKDYNYIGYLISTFDEYLNEYVPEHAKRLQYITNFTGSNGIAIILPETNLFFTDSRYLMQAKLELDPKSYLIFNWSSLFDQQFPWFDYLPQNIKWQSKTTQGSTKKIAYNPKLFSRKTLEIFAHLPLEAKEYDFVDQIWSNQPPNPAKAKLEIIDYPLKFTGLDHSEKLAKCTDFIEQYQAEALVITDPSLLCWLLNIRAYELEFSPLFLAKGVITRGQSYLFSDNNNYRNIDDKPITILPAAKFSNFIANIAGKILFEPDYCSDYVRTCLEEKDYQHVKNPCYSWRAEKNETEIKVIKQGHIEDAIAVCEALSYLSRQEEDIASLSEYDVSLLMTKIRRQNKNYLMDSFPAICGFQENGAIIHYRATKDKAKKLQGDGLLLIDSGGQYLGCTTDITRTVAIGKIDLEHKKYYSLVLKGHIALARATFPVGKVEGAHLDILARQFLWRDGSDYGHSTGHGVGNFLNVHESPPNISMVFGKNILRKNMVLSNEPGYYRAGDFGIRIENMMYICEAEKLGFLRFENFTLVPYAKNLIDFNLLTIEEIDYLKRYYQEIKDRILPSLTLSAQAWLAQELTI